MKQFSFLAEDKRLLLLSEMGDPLEKIAGKIDFEGFRPVLDVVFVRVASDKGGRKPYDSLLMFKIMLLQEWYGIADDSAEYIINDRLSFQRFLGLSLGDKVPDAKTIWLYREGLKNSGKYKDLFQMFERAVENTGVITRKGSIIDASFTDAPRQRNSREENKKIKDGKADEIEGWSENKRRQKDVDARWTRKDNEMHFGYKDHVKVDADSKLIVSYSVTAASVHDSNEAAGLVDEKDEVLNADSAYVGEDLHAKIREKNAKIILKVNEKGYRNKPLTAEQKASNCEKSRVRARVEHVFAHMTVSMGGMLIRTIGLARAKCKIALKNLAYNISRWVYLLRAGKTPKVKGAVCPFLIKV